MSDKKLIPGSTFGGILLIGGSCIGAGMLALPVLLGLIGFIPSLLVILSVLGFMTLTALLLVEVNGWFYKQVNIVSMAGESLGKAGKALAWMLYLFLFYSLLVAYISVSGSIFSGFAQQMFSLALPSNLASILFVILFGIIVYFGTRPVDFLNRVLMFGLIGAYLGMVLLGISKVSFNLLLYTDLKYLFLPWAVLITSFGFNNMIPSLTSYMKGDLKRIRYTIIGGSSLALIVYFFWIILVLGIVPVEGKMGLLSGYKNGVEASSILISYLGTSAIGTFSSYFAFFAIATSFLAQSLSLMHFLADGLKIEINKKNSVWLWFLTLLPPLVFALIYPQLFFKALGFAGGICAVILFGILPVLMAWIGRYKKKLTSLYHLKGGKPLLILLFLFSLFILFTEAARLFN